MRGLISTGATRSARSGGFQDLSDHRSVITCEAKPGRPHHDCSPGIAADLTQSESDRRDTHGTFNCTFLLTFRIAPTASRGYNQPNGRSAFNGRNGIGRISLLRFDLTEVR